MKCELRSDNCPNPAQILSKLGQTVQNGAGILTYEMRTTDGDPGVVAKNATDVEADWTDRRDAKPSEDVLSGNLLAMERARA